MPEVLVQMTGIMKSFPGVKALNNAQLTLYKGEILGLLGENGAGKSTLMNCLGGIYKQDDGTIEIEGKKVEINTVHDAQQLGIAFIHQEIALVPYLSVAENIFLGRERTTGGLVDQGKMREEAKQWLHMVGLDIDPGMAVGDLSIGMQQMVEIAKACSLNMKLMIMDEPTSSLSEREVESLFAMMRSLRDRGIGLIYISHKLSEIFTITDRVCVMRDGGYVGTIITPESQESDLVRMMVGRELTNYYTRNFLPQGDELLRVEHVSGGRMVRDCSFNVHKGEIVGFYGLVGAGRSELLKVPRLGPKVFKQCAGFIRVEGPNPLDNSAIHPETYPIVDRMASVAGVTVSELVRNEEKITALRERAGEFASEDFGLPTITDILDELSKPGRDPRKTADTFSFDENVHEIEDLQEGMELPGMVTNVTEFGAFVDIGVHTSRMNGHKPKIGEPLIVRVASVDLERNRIGLAIVSKYER